MPKVMLLLFLLTEKAMSAPEIASRLAVSERQAYRLLAALQDIGCVLEKSAAPRYRVSVTEWPEPIRKYNFKKDENRIQ